MSEEKREAVVLAEKKLAEIKANKDKKEAESKAAAEKENKDSSSKDTSKQKEGEGSEAKEAKEKAEAQAKVDAGILEKDEKDLSDTEKARKVELDEIKKKKDESQTPEQKMQKRIGELSGELKDIKRYSDEKDTKAQAKIKELEDNLAKLNKVQNKEDQKTQEEITRTEANKAEQDRLTKWKDEDKDKPYAERRHMSDDELSDFFVTDQVGAQKWISESTIRNHEAKKKDVEDRATSAYVKELMRDQNASAARTLIKHPELDTIKREGELKAEGKEPKEIQKIIYDENEKVRIVTDIMRKNPEWLQEKDGPERAVAEMEKIMSGNTKSEKKEKKEEKGETQEERDARIREEGAVAERARLASLDEGAGSSHQKETKEAVAVTAEDKELQRLGKRSGISYKKLKERQAFRKERGYGRPLSKEERDS